MGTSSKIRFGIKSSSLSVSIVLCGIFLSTVFPASSVQQRRHEKAVGIAWRVKGAWRTETQDRIIVNGDAIEPGSLVHPVQAAGGHSILILLPDGQRVLYECFLPGDCAHSFRVPTLYRTPEPFAVDLMARIHQVLSRAGKNPSSGEHHEQSLPRDEFLAAIGPSNQVEIGGLAAALPNGEYTYNFRPVAQRSRSRSGMVLQKDSPTITLKLPSPGMYDITVFDRLNTPRIDLFVAAVLPEHEASGRRSFTEAHALMTDWNEDYQGWPIHDLQRAYLESLSSNIVPTMEDLRQPSTATYGSAADVTAEPTFSPTPGLLKVDTAVTFACKAPHAIMHYTVDGSQPLSSSQVYLAPVMVKGTALTIKAFASAPGKKDSAVVTGIFRIGN